MDHLWLWQNFIRSIHHKLHVFIWGLAFIITFCFVRVYCQYVNGKNSLNSSVEDSGLVESSIRNRMYAENRYFIHLPIYSQNSRYPSTRSRALLPNMRARYTFYKYILSPPSKVAASFFCNIHPYSVSKALLTLLVQRYLLRYVWKRRRRKKKEKILECFYCYFHSPFGI